MAILAQSLLGLGLTLNQVELMERDNVAARAGNLQELGVVPMPMAYLVTALASQRAAETADPPEINAPACGRWNASRLSGPAPTRPAPKLQRLGASLRRAPAVRYS